MENQFSRTIVLKPDEYSTKSSFADFLPSERSLTPSLSLSVSLSPHSLPSVLECFQEDSRCQSTMEFDDFSPLKHHHSMVHCAFLPATFYRIRRRRHPTPASHPLENTARTHTSTHTYTHTHTNGRVQLPWKLVRTYKRIRYP